MYISLGVNLQPRICCVLHRNEFGNKGIPTQKSYEEWDCTALFQATLYAKSFRSPDGTGNLKTLDELYVKPRGVPHGQFHGSVISANGDPYETFALSIDQLRRLRNSLCHSTSTELDQNMFDKYVDLAKDAFEALSVKTDSIEETLHEELHTLRARVVTCAFFLPIYKIFFVTLKSTTVNHLSRVP